MTTQAVLDRAAAIIDRHGWCQHTDLDTAGAYCMMAAVDRACPPGDPHRPAAVAELAARVFGDRTAWIAERIAWNDEPGRSLEDVRSVLRRASALGC